MTPLLIDAGWLDALTWRDMAVGSFVLLVALATIVKAIKDIRTDGWQPFKDRWITPRKARRKRLDMVLESQASMQTTLERIDAEMRTNGGSSVKDMVIRIDQKVEHIQARVRHQDETSDAAIFELDETARLTFANRAFREMVNAEEGDLIKRNYISRVHPDERSRFLREISEAIENKMPIDTTVNFRYDDRGFISVSLVARPDVRPGGQLIGFFGTASKISQP